MLLCHSYTRTTCASVLIGTYRTKQTVKRWHIWSDIQRTFGKPCTNPTCPLRVVFIGEPAEDQGGPRREFFHLSLASATGSLFCGEPWCRTPLRNAGALIRKTYLHVGWLISMLISHGGPGPSCFALWVFSYLSAGLDKLSVSTSDIPQPNVRYLLSQVK